MFCCLICLRRAVIHWSHILDGKETVLNQNRKCIEYLQDLTRYGKTMVNFGFLKGVWTDTLQKHLLSSPLPQNGRKRRTTAQNELHHAFDAKKKNLKHRSTHLDPYSLLYHTRHNITDTLKMMRLSSFTSLAILLQCTSSAFAEYRNEFKVSCCRILFGE